MRKIIYTALFVDDIQALVSLFPPKHSTVFAHHCTIAFRPPNLEGIEVGKKLKLQVLGRVSDDKGDALIVKKYKTLNTRSHITLSCAENVVPTYSKELLESAFENGLVEMFIVPVEISVTEGFFDGISDAISL
jgi:hypothetical protein